MQNFNIYMIGVGGQGIGLLSEVLAKAASLAGLPAKGVDTHGLAQRGGTVESFLRIGNNIFSPLVREDDANLVIALERHEALRGLNKFAKHGASVLYYNTVWQPLAVRMREAKETSEQEIEQAAKEQNVKVLAVFQENLPDVRMQNVVLLAHIAKNNLIPGISKENYHQALQHLLPSKVAESNLNLFHSLQ